MRITQWGEFGVHIAVYLASRSRAGTPTVGAGEIAKVQGIELQYAQQILLRLREGGIVTSVRGPHGGYQLARSEFHISLLDILRAAEGDTFEIICESRPLSEDRCAPKVPCGLREIWYGLREHVNTYLQNHTLAVLLEDSGLIPELVQISGARTTKSDSPLR